MSTAVSFNNESLGDDTDDSTASSGISFHSKAAIKHFCDVDVEDSGSVTSSSAERNFRLVDGSKNLRLRELMGKQVRDLEQQRSKRQRDLPDGGGDGSGNPDAGPKRTVVGIGIGWGEVRRKNKTHKGKKPRKGDALSLALSPGSAEFGKASSGDLSTTAMPSRVPERASRVVGFSKERFERSQRPAVEDALAAPKSDSSGGSLDPCEELEKKCLELEATGRELSERIDETVLRALAKKHLAEQLEGHAVFLRQRLSVRKETTQPEHRESDGGTDPYRRKLRKLLANAGSTWAFLRKHHGPLRAELERVRSRNKGLAVRRHRRQNATAELPGTPGHQRPVQNAQPS